MSNYVHYRASTVGLALEQELDDMMRRNEMTEEQKAKIFETFDEAVKKELPLVQGKAVLKGHIERYHNRDGVWTFIMDDIKFQTGGELLSSKGFTHIILAPYR